MKLRKRLFSFVIAIALLFSYIPSVNAVNDNIALNKTVSASSSYPNRSWTPDKAVDGVVDNKTTKNSRWASKRATGTSNEGDGDVGSKEQWLMVDLGANYKVSQINIFWEAAFAKEYKLQYSLDGVEFNDLKDVSITFAGLVKENDFESVEARYIRVYCLEPNNASYGYSIFELEIYQEVCMESASDVIAQVQKESPTLSQDGKHIILPSVPDEYEISLYGSDNKQVINLNGEVIKPLTDMKVNVVYKVVNKNDSKDSAVSTIDSPIIIQGSTQREVDDNDIPNVLPGLREWKGYQGEFELTSTSRIVYTNESLSDEALMIQSYFKGMLEKNIEIANDHPRKGDIYLVDGKTTEELGKEGYYLDIQDYVTIIAPTYQGMIYGGASITQILYQDAQRIHAPKGLARDYPQYEVRAGFIDVGRTYIPLEYLKEMTIYMSWYKMNEIQVHVNDYWGASGYSAFRLESEVYPMITAKDGYYKKDDYRNYQKEMKKYGIDVITEIDTPYHSAAFKNIPGVKMLNEGSLDITNDEAFNTNREIIENLIDEYLDGPNPVVQSDKFHIGTDEYDKKYSEQMRKWTDHFINYVNAKGYETRLWGSLGSRGFNGTTPVSNKATVNLWAAYWSDIQETFDAGYDIINTEGGWLYIVPGGNAGYPDRYDTKKLYEQFEVNNFASKRSGCGKIMPAAHPQTKGAEFAVWNDMTSFRTGFSWFDIYDRFKEAVALVSEKTWYGEDEQWQTYDQFRARVDALQNKVPNANPGRYVESKDDLIVDYDFFSSDNTLKDLTDNHYDAAINNAILKNGSLIFNGDGYLSLPMKSVGYPYTLLMSFSLDEINENSILFSGNDGILFASIDGKIGYQRGSYTFVFDYQINPGEKVDLAIACDTKNAKLFIDGNYIGDGKLTNETIAGKAQQSSTFVLPVEKLFENCKGSLSSFSIYKKALNEKEIKDKLGYASRDNYALNKPVTASSLEVSDGRFTADKAVDGIVSSNSRVSFGRAQDEQWLLIDLEKPTEFSEILINFESTVGKYEIQISDDGETFKTIYVKNEEKVIGATPKVEVIKIEPVTARYVRYVQKERWQHANNGNSYSGSIYEFEIHCSLKDEMFESIKAFEDVLDQYTVGYSNGQLDEKYYQDVTDMLKELKEFATLDSFTQKDLEEAKTRLNKEIKNIEKYILFVKEDAINAFNNLKQLDYHNYTVTSYNEMIESLNALEPQLDVLSNYKEVDLFIGQLNVIESQLIKVDNFKLIELIKEVEALDLSQYVDVSKLQVVLQDAKAVYESPESQEVINNIYQELLNVYNSLEKKPIDPTTPNNPSNSVDNEYDYSNDSNSNSVKTGDDVELIIYGGLFVVTALSILVSVKRRINNYM